MRQMEKAARRAGLLGGGTGRQPVSSALLHALSTEINSLHHFPANDWYGRLATPFFKLIAGFADYSCWSS